MCIKQDNDFTDGLTGDKIKTNLLRDNSRCQLIQARQVPRMKSLSLMLLWLQSTNTTQQNTTVQHYVMNTDV